MTLDQAVGRSKHWGYDRALLKTLPQAARWIDELGFSLLFEHKGQALPALWVRATTPTPDERFDWGPEAETVWGWKDELPKRGLAWYGHFVNGRKSFLSPQMLRWLYPHAGRADDFRSIALSAEAKRITEVLLPSGPQSAATLREATDLRGAPFERAIKELGRALVITHHGTEEQGAGWPSAMFELTARAFDVGGARDLDAAAERFLRTVLSCQPNHLARALNLTSAHAKPLLDALVRRGVATRDGTRISIAAQRGVMATRSVGRATR
jgi:hypothetical protein